jgi:hypothetical protein
MMVACDLCVFAKPPYCRLRQYGSKQFEVEERERGPHAVKIARLG